MTKGQQDNKRGSYTCTHVDVHTVQMYSDPGTHHTKRYIHVLYMYVQCKDYYLNCIHVITGRQLELEDAAVHVR